MRRSSRLESVASNDVQLSKTEAKAVNKLITSILKKDVSARTEEDLDLMQKYNETVTFLCKRQLSNKLVKEREQEVEETVFELEEKCKRLAATIEESRSLIVYTGAGISTAASIPDYRGPQGVWTLLKQGKECRTLDLSLAEPTFTHMAIAELYKKGYVKRVVSQNCDGLHLRSGLPRSALSELHGNMFLEVCKTCQPMKEYFRLFDVTERTGMRRHKTGRSCHKCKSPLHDTIVHFGEKSPFTTPHNWQQASNAANKADVILCLGTSLKVLKKYACLWATHKSPEEQPRLIIINLQWTPKDKKAELKINGRCDDVMRHVTKYLKIDMTPYDRYSDPLLHLSSPLSSHEFETTSKTILPIPEGFIKKSPEDLKVKVKRRKFIARSASQQSEGDEDVSSLYDEDSLASFMQTRYHVDEELQAEVRRQPIRFAKVKQFLIKRKSEWDLAGDSIKVQKVEGAQGISRHNLDPFDTPASSRPDLSANILNNEIASSDRFNESSVDGSLNDRSMMDTVECDSCCSIPSEVADGRTSTDGFISFPVNPSMTPPPSNDSCVDCQNIHDQQLNSLLTFDCDYASIEEVTSVVSEVEGCEAALRDGEVAALITPGWFGKGMQTRKTKRKRTRRQK